MLYISHQTICLIYDILNKQCKRNDFFFKLTFSCINVDILFSDTGEKKNVVISVLDKLSDFDYEVCKFCVRSHKYIYSTITKI